MAWFNSIIPLGTQPKVLHASSANESTASTLSYTFTEAGKFQYYAFEWHPDTSSYTRTISIKLNDVELTPTVWYNSINPSSVSYAEITVSAGDTISLTNTSTFSNSCMQLFVCKNAIIDDFEWIGMRGNDGVSFDIDHPGYVILEPYQCSYHGSRNTFNWLTINGYEGLDSIIVPSGFNPYFYGFTYAFCLSRIE